MRNEKQMVTLLREAREDPQALQSLTPRMQTSLVNSFTQRCRAETKEAIARNVAKPFNQWPGRPLIERIFVELDAERVTYCAGQSYDDEMRELRKELVAFT